MKHKILAIILLTLNSQMLFVSGANPLGIRWVQEMFLGLLVIYTFLYFLQNLLSGERFKSNDLFVLLIVSVIMIVSSIFSLIQYKQPLVYGLIESRQALSLLIYFPLMRLNSKSHLDALLILYYIVAISLAIFILAMLMKFGLVSSGIMVENTDMLRADRNSIGRYYMILSYIISLVIFYNSRQIKWGLLLLVFLYAIFYILQERQTMFAILLLTSIYFLYTGIKMDRFKSSLLMAFFFLILGSFFIYGLEEQKENIVMLLGTVLSEDVFESARAQTIATIWDELKNSNGMGFGALSLMWNNGFHRLYGSNFYLGDVGLFGTAFRLGIISIPLVLYVTFKLIIILRRMKPSVSKDVVALGYLYALFTLPTSGLLEYRGHYLGLLFFLATSSTYVSYTIRRKYKITRYRK